MTEPSSTTEAAVSSHEVSMPSTRLMVPTPIPGTLVKAAIRSDRDRAPDHRRAVMSKSSSTEASMAARRSV